MGVARDGEELGRAQGGEAGEQRLRVCAGQREDGLGQLAAHLLRVRVRVRVGVRVSEDRVGQLAAHRAHGHAALAAALLLARALPQHTWLGLG